jgi:hypothetical protein
MSFKDLNIDHPGVKKQPSDTIEQRVNYFEQTSNFGYEELGEMFKQNSSRLTFRQADFRDASFKDDRNKEYETQQDDEYTPKKLDQLVNLKKNPSLVFKSAKRNIIYFEDEQENESC